MSRAEKHPTDEGKYQSTFDTYGHGEGNGKSRASVYKHHKKWSASQVEEEIESEIDSSDTISPEYNWNTISWLDDSEGDDSEEKTSPTIPNPIRRIVSGGKEGEMTAAQAATQRQLIRWGFMGLDRGVTHWGRGVMSKPKWELERHPSDYDALEAATTNLLDSHGVTMNLSPELVWGTVVGAAYIPPMVYVSKNADPNRKKGIMNRLRTMFKRRRLPRHTESTVGDEKIESKYS